MEQYVLYLLFKDILKDDLLDLGFSISFNDIDIKKNKAVGCYVRGGQVSRYRELSSGSYINVNNRVSFRANCGLTKDELMDGLSLLNNIKYKVIKLNNKILTLDSLPVRIVNGEFVECEGLTGSCKIVISNISLLSDILFLGKTEQGISRYTLNINVVYKIMED
jgi:hypothetical protein